MSVLSNAKNTIFMGSTFKAPQGDFHSHTYLGTRQGMDLLTKSIAPGAFHNSSERYDPPKCHPSTRVAVLQHIMTWINDLQRICFFMWLYGPAGAGKSAITQSIAELCHEANLLAASFFFSRTAVGRNDESRLIPTLVYQLCLTMPAIRNDVEAIIEKDPLVLSRSMEAQIRSLVVDPLRRALIDEETAKCLRSGPKLIIIDGLDECGTGKVQRYILSVLVTAVQQVSLPISFLVASRPEQMIRQTFLVEPLCSMTRRLALDDSYRPDDDIKLFFLSKFDEIKQNHPLRDFLPPEWPSYSQLARLVQKSSGQFIYASTVLKYLDSPHQRPTDGLDIVSGLSSPGRDTPFAELDALYIHIFSTVKDIDKALELLSLLLLSQTRMFLTPKRLEALFFLRPGDVFIILSDLHSLVHVPMFTDYEPLNFFHASLGDFLLDKSRSDKFYIDAGNAHAKLTRYFLKHLSKMDSLSEDTYFAEAFTLHCAQSSPIPNLLDDLSKLDLYWFLKTFCPFRGHSLYVLNWLKEHLPQNSSGKDLYSHHLSSLDKYLRFELALLMTCSKHLGQVIATAVTLPTFIQHYPLIRNILEFDLGCDTFKNVSVSKAMASFCPIPDEMPLDTSGDTSYVDNLNYHTLLSEFLSNPIRSQEYYIDGGKYATLATIFTKFLFGSILNVSSDSVNQNVPTVLQDDYLSCVFSCFPDCLLKASPSKDLALFLQSHEIPSDFQDKLYYGYSSEATVAAIKAYILRCNISETADENVTMDQHCGCCHVM